MNRNVKINVENPGEPRTAFLDGMRGLAAVYVVIHHALLWLNPGYQYGALLRPAEYGIAKLTLLSLSQFMRFGQSAVLFFFVLSGFVIHLRFARKFAASRPVRQSEWLPFLWRRAKRLYPPMILAFFVTSALDHIGASRGYGPYFQRTPYPVMNSNIAADHRLTTLVGNLMFLMQTYCPVWGTDSPLWSLKYEWWFYAIYPALWPLLRRSLTLATAAVVALFVLSASPRIWPGALSREVCSAFMVWWLGALLAEIYAGRLRIPFRSVAYLVFLLPFAMMASMLKYSPPWVVWGLGFTGLMAAAFEWERRGGSLKLLGSLKPLGDCSYTLYVIHAPILVFVSGYLMARSHTGELPSNFGWVFAALGVIPLAYALHFVVERPFVGPHGAYARGAAGSLPGAPELDRTPAFSSVSASAAIFDDGCELDTHATTGVTQPVGDANVYSHEK